MNNLHKYILVCCAAFICTFRCFGENNNAEQPYITQVVEAYGSTDNEALKNAFHEAVRKAIGFFLVAKKTTIDDSSTIEICTNADALVVEHKVLKRTILEDGVICLQVEAQIMRQKFSELLATKTTTNIDETSIVDIKRRKDSLSDTKKSLQILFENYPNNLLDMQLLGRLELSDDADIDNSTYDDITYKILISVNQAAYSNFIKKLKELLKVTSKNYAQFRGQSYAKTKHFFTANKDEHRIYIEEFVNPQKTIEFPNTVKYTMFSVSSNIESYIYKLCSISYREGTTIQVDFLDEAKEVVHTDYFGTSLFQSYYSLYPINQNNWELRALYYDEENDNRISSYPIMSHSRLLFAPFIDYSLMATITVKTRIPSDTINRIKTCRIILCDSEMLYKTNNEFYNIVKPINNVTSSNSSAGLPFLGVVLGWNAYSGVRIRNVVPNSPAARAGLRANDIILKINKHNVRDENDFGIYLKSRFFPGNTITLLVKRNQNTFSVSAQLTDFKSQCNSVNFQ